jgi:hypothetical protein
MTPASRDRLWTLQHRYAPYLFVAGAVTVGIASFLYFTAPEKERVDRTVFTPVVGPSEVGFSLSRGF